MGHSIKEMGEEKSGMECCEHAERKYQQQVKNEIKKK